jgi:TldD protein
MVLFPEHLYTDLRIEDVSETKIQYTLGILDEVKQKNYRAAFIRIFDGKRWYYSATTELENLQGEIDALAAMATANARILQEPVVRKLEINTDDCLRFEGDRDISRISIQRKTELLNGYSGIISGREYVEMWRSLYLDQRVTKTFLSSKGAKLTYDYQKAGVRISMHLSAGDKKFKERFDAGGNLYSDLEGKKHDIEKKYRKAVSFLLNAEEIKAGDYTVILSPMAAGVFAHESFGHKSEADFMLGDETMKKEWQIGKEVGTKILSIVDDGEKTGVGYVPYDDEGSKSRETYLIKNGVLDGRLHSASTAVDLHEELTGNARALNFEFEPIVRMTTTYILGGEKTFDELVGEVKDGILVETIQHGSGLSTFTIAPSLAYRIRNGKVAGPVKISVITGDVFKTLSEIDGLSDKVELLSFVTGGCGKMEQQPLPVGFGGPWVRVRKLHVQ